MSLDDIRDLNEAKLIIDLNKDEITSLKNTLRMVEIKANKSIAEANYKTNTEKNKYESANRELLRHKEELIKAKADQQKLLQNHKEADVKSQEALKEVQERIKTERQTSKQLHNQMKEHQIHVQQLREQLHSKFKQVKEYKRIVNVARILEMTQQQQMGEIPPYLDLMNLLKDQSSRMSELQQKLDSITQQTIGEITTRERKISSFQRELRNLEAKNHTLTTELTTVAQVIQGKEQEMMSQMEIIERDNQFWKSTFENMNSEMLQLRSSVNNYERESIIDQVKDESLNLLHELHEEFGIKEKQYEKEYTDLYNQHEQYKVKHEQLEEDMKLRIQKMEQANIEQEEEICALEQQIRSKEDMIRSIEGQTSIFEVHMEQMSHEIDRWKGQAEETLKSKNEIKAILKGKEEEFEMKDQQMIEELDTLRSKVEELQVIKLEEEFNYKNLQKELSGDRDWKGIYRRDLSQRNAYLMKLYSLICK